MCVRPRAISLDVVQCQLWANYDIALFDHKRTFRGAIAMTALPPTADIQEPVGLSAKCQKPMCPSYRQDRGAVRQPITVASMVLALPTFRHAPSDHWQRYGIM